MIRQSTAAISFIAVVTTLVQVQVSRVPALESHRSVVTQGLLAGRTPDVRVAGLPGPAWVAPIADMTSRRPMAPGDGRAGDSEFPGRALQTKAAKGEPYVPGMLPMGGNPWWLSQAGYFPEVAQLLLTWLFFVLMTNAAVCWIGCLEHEQKSGVALVQ